MSAKKRKEKDHIEIIDAEFSEIQPPETPKRKSTRGKRRRLFRVSFDLEIDVPEGVDSLDVTKVLNFDRTVLTNHTLAIANYGETASGTISMATEILPMIPMIVFYQPTSFRDDHITHRVIGIVNFTDITRGRR